MFGSRVVLARPLLDTLLYLSHPPLLLRVVDGHYLALPSDTHTHNAHTHRERELQIVMTTLTRYFVRVLQSPRELVFLFLECTRRAR